MSRTEDQAISMSNVPKADPVLDRNHKQLLLRKLWPERRVADDDLDEDSEFSAFFDFVRQEIQRAEPHIHNAHPDMSTLEIALDTLERLRTFPQSETIEIPGGFREPENFYWVLKLAIHIWCGLEVVLPRSFFRQIRPSETGARTWDGSPTFHDLIKGAFPRAKGDQGHSRGRIDHSFTATSLVRSNNIQILWTSDLGDHLKFNAARRTLTVYEHKICLLSHIAYTDGDILPLDPMKEALATLDLLFPFADPSTKEFLTKERKLSLYGLGAGGRDRSLDLSRYPIWGHTLAQLHEIFNEPPRDLKQLMRDRRNMKDWANLWIAVFVILLTFVSIAFGTVSTVYSIKQYQLGVALACLEHSVLLPQFCS